MQISGLNKQRVWPRGTIFIHITAFQYYFVSWIPFGGIPLVPSDLFLVTLLL